MKTRTLLVAVLALTVVAAHPRALRAAPPCDPTPVNLTDAEKAKIRELLKLMWKMSSDTTEHRTETLNACLNPATQTGTKAKYEKSHSKDFGDSDARIADAVRHYLQMMRSNTLQKNPCSGGGGATTMQPGLENDKVEISGKLLATWCDPAASAKARASAKFWIMATLANEMTHVYQKDEPAWGTPDWDPARCDEERDSDLMSAKFLMRLKGLLTDSMGNPRTLAQISAQGRAGECLVMCLTNIGVDTPAELADVVADVMSRLDFYNDREMNLFQNAIDNGISWYDLYYNHKYKSPARLRVDDTMFTTMRKLKVTWGGVGPIDLVVPEDGKTIVSYTVKVDAMGRVIVVVVTRGADGSFCVWTFTDTDGDGVPENNPVGTAFPPVFTGDPIPGFHDLWILDAHLNTIGFNDSVLLHDRRTGSLSAVELSDSGVATGAFRMLVRSPLIARPTPSNPTAGPFFTLLNIDESSTPGTIRFLFTSEQQYNIGPQSAALLGIHDIVTGTWTLQNTTRAVALSPRNPLGPDYIPIRLEGLSLMSNPGDTVQVTSVGYGTPQIVTLSTIGTNGITFAGSPPTQAGPDIFRITSLAGNGVVEHAQARSGVVVDVFDHDIVGGPAPDTLVLSAFPGRLAVFSGDPLPAAYQLYTEIATQDAEPGLLDADSPTSPLMLAEADGDIPLISIPGSPLLVQKLADLDGDGLADDAAVIARTPSTPGFVVYMVIDATSPAPIWFNTGPLPIEPAGFAYLDINHDSRTDLRVEDAAGGPSYCLVSNGLGGFMPVPCPAACIADFDHSGVLSVMDIFAFLNAWFAGDPAADIDGGGLAVSDIFSFLNIWFMGC
ncbi:MAG TPA: GC-type dockerin domain-anchored protein [Phycisphaerales bacterium]|nr:GC-type dockerin domain-anchored protein [Phycisphaerales bacterium]